MGTRVVAFHIHQVEQTEEGLKNHRPIQCWFGPQINFTSLLYHLWKGSLPPAPIFLEVKGAGNVKKSLEAYDLLHPGL